MTNWMMYLKVLIWEQPQGKFASIRVKRRALVT